MAVPNSSQDPSGTESPPDIHRSGITILCGGLESVVDIVILHGLGGSPEKTWKHDEGFFWPWELRKDVSDARVMLFGYNADTDQGFSTNLSRIKDYARGLLGALVDEREEDQELNRPLIFVGHSLGGLVIKQALVEAGKAVITKKGDWHLVYNATKAIVFFGTPHLGSGAGQQLRVQLLKMFASVALVKIPPKIDDALRTHSDELCDLADDFRSTSLWTERRLEIYTYYETETDSKLGQKVVDEMSSKIGYDKETSLPIHANHVGMVKFRHREDANYKNVCGKIKRLRRHAMNIVRDTSESKLPSYPAHALAPVKAFVPREKLLGQLKEQLWRATDDIRSRNPRKVGIWGMGGVGKSQLALSYLQQHGGDYNATFWIAAQDPTSVEKCFREIYESLPAEKPPGELVTADKARVAVLTWFSDRVGKWLIIFDGADELDGEDRNFINLALYIPRSSNVHVIVTSRNQNIRNFSTFDSVQVGRLEHEEAVGLFCKNANIQLSQRGDQARAEVEQIVAALDFLALAISIAGSYVSTVPRLHSDLSQYLQEYLQRKHQLLQRQPNKLNDMYAHSVMTAWETSYQAIHHRSPAACHLLTLLAFLDNRQIFLDLFVFDAATPNTAPMQSEYPWYLAIGLQDNATASDIEEMLSLLEKYSMLHWSEVDQSYSMHGLVHAWCHGRISDTQVTKQYAFAALQLLCNAISVLGSGRQAGRRLGPHVKQNIFAVSQLRTSTLERLSLLAQLQYVGEFLFESASLREASFVLGISLDMHQKTVGDEASCVINIIDTLAHSLLRQAKFDEASAVLREAIAKSGRFTAELKSTLDVNIEAQKDWLALWSSCKDLVAAYEQRHREFVGWAAQIRDNRSTIGQQVVRAQLQWSSRLPASHPIRTLLTALSKVSAEYETTTRTLLSRIEAIAEGTWILVERARELITLYVGALEDEPPRYLTDLGGMKEHLQMAIDVDVNLPYSSLEGDSKAMKELSEKIKELSHKLCLEMEGLTVGELLVSQVKAWVERLRPQRGTSGSDGGS